MGNEVVIAPDLTSVTIRGKVFRVVIGPDGSIRIGNRLFGPPPAEGQTMQYGGAQGGGGGAGGSGGHPKTPSTAGPPGPRSNIGSPGVHASPFFWGGKWAEYDDGAHGFHGEPVGKRKVAQEGGGKKDNGKAGRRRGPRPPKNSNNQ